jgi:hypothetical protein
MLEDEVIGGEKLKITREQKIGKTSTCPARSTRFFESIASSCTLLVSYSPRLQIETEAAWMMTGRMVPGVQRDIFKEIPYRNDGCPPADRILQGPPTEAGPDRMT